MIRLSLLRQRIAALLGTSSSLVSPVSEVIETTGAAGTPIVRLTDPFAGLDAGVTTHAAAGAVPPQLALDGATVVRGAARAVSGVTYRLTIVSRSGDGRSITRILTFIARGLDIDLPLPTPAPTPAPTPTPTPAPTPTPTPAPAPAPTITFDAPTSSIAEGNSGSKILSSVLSLNRDGLAGDRVVNLTYSGTAQRGTDYTAPDTITVTAGTSAANLDLVVLGDTVFENDELAVITASLAGYSSATASKTITIVNDDVAPFTEQPTISNDGTPSVGETFAFTFGAHPNGLGTKRLLRNGVDFADATIGSYTAADADAGKTLTLVVRDASGTAMASVSINVAAAVAADLPAFTLSNPDNFVSGTNPPRFRVSIPGPPESNFDKSLHEMIVEWDNASNGTFSVAAARSARVADLMAFADKEDATIDNLTKQPEGQPYRVRVRPIRKSDGAEGPNSNFFIDTMAAAQIAPTSFDPALAGAGTPNDAIRLSNTNRTAALGYALSDQAAWSPLARGIGAKVSFTFAIAPKSDGSPGPTPTTTYGFLFGTTRVGNERKLAMVPGYTEVNGAQVATFDFSAADTVTFELVANATTPANIDILVSKNGAGATRLVLNSPAPLFFAGFLSGDPGRTVTISDFTHWGTV